jgi:hypothetical protein
MTTSPRLGSRASPSPATGESGPAGVALVFVALGLPDLRSVAIVVLLPWTAA